MNKIVNIAVVGLGQVGIYLLNELNTKNKDIELKTGKKINPFIGSDFFYRFPDDNVFARLRYKIGATLSLVNRTKLTVEYWRQFSLTDKFVEPEANFLVVNLTYGLN